VRLISPKPQRYVNFLPLVPRQPRQLVDELRAISEIINSDVRARHRRICFAVAKLATVCCVSRLTRSPNVLRCRPTRIRCENYGKIILERGVHRFNYEIFQTLAYVGCLHRSNIILMVRDDGLNCGSFLLGSHAGNIQFPARRRQSKKGRRPQCHQLPRRGDDGGLESGRRGDLVSAPATLARTHKRADRSRIALQFTTCCRGRHVAGKLDPTLLQTAAASFSRRSSHPHFLHRLFPKTRSRFDQYN
jgi:hypothetical protein